MSYLSVAGLLTLLILPFSDSGDDYETRFEGDHVVVSGIVSEKTSGSSGSGSGSGAAGGSGVLVRCDRVDVVHVGEVVLSRCVLVGEFDASGGFVLSDDLIPRGGPAGPGVPAVDPVVVTASDLRSLPIVSGDLVVQPSGGRVLINAEVVGYSTATRHVLDAVVMGVDVQVRLTPVRWVWQFQGDDRGPFATDHPGGPFPDLSVHGVYSLVGQGRVLRAEITWMGEYRVGTSPWFLIDGNATTIVQSAPFETIEAPARLVTTPTG